MFKPVFIEGTTLQDTWNLLLFNLDRHGKQYHITKGSYAGQYRLTFDFVAGFIKYPHKRPWNGWLPEGCNIPEPTDDKIIDDYFANYLMNGDCTPNEHYKYGTFIVGGVGKVYDNYITNSWYERHYPNQLEWVINHFKNSGYGNAHCSIIIGEPESKFAYDAPFKNESERGTSACLQNLDFRIINSVLTCNVYYRSWSLWGGWPTNMGGFALLTQFIASELGDVEPGPLSFSCKDLHCYSQEFDLIKQRLHKDNNPFTLEK